MKKILILLCLLPSLMLAQSNLDNKIRAKDLNHRGLSDYRYKAGDSIAVNVTLPAAVTTATSAMTMATANATGIASLTPTVSRLALPRSINLFNPVDPLNQGGKQLSSDGLSVFTATNFYVTGPIPVKPNTTYYPSGKNRVGFYSTSAISSLVAIELGTRTGNAFTTPAGTNYIRLSIDLSTNPLATYQISEGSTALPYQPYAAAKLTVISDRQLFNVNDPANLYGQFLSSTGTLGVLAGWNVTHFIATAPGQVLYPSIKHNVAFYDANKNLITPSPDATIYSSARASQALITPPGAAYVRFRVDVATWPFFSVILGSSPVPWEPYVTPLDIPTTATVRPLKLIIGAGQSNGQGAVDYSQTHRTPMPWGTYPPGYSGPLDGSTQISSATAVGNNRTFSNSGPSFIPLTGIGYNMTSEGYARGFMDHIATKYPGEDMVYFSHAQSGKSIEYLDKPTASEITSGTAAGGLTIPNTSGEYLMQVAGKSIAQITEYDLAQFVSPYYQGMWLIAKSTQLARTEGKAAEVAAVLWLQGEANADGGTLNYSALLQALYDDYNRDVLLITGQTKKVNWFFEQTNYSNQSEISGQAGYDNWVSHSYSAAYDIGGASSSYRVETARINDHYIINPQQVAAARDGIKSLPARNMYLWGPRYHLTSRLHMDTYVARRHGEEAAKMYARQILEGQTPVAPFLPTSWWIEGASVYVRFQVPKPPLQLVSPPNSVTVTGKGRGFVHSAGAIQPGNVSVISDDVIKITPDVAPVAGQTISYVVNVRSGDVCDSDTQAGLFTDRAGTYYTLTNYALPFSLTLTSPAQALIDAAQNTAIASNTAAISGLNSATATLASNLAAANVALTNASSLTTGTLSDARLNNVGTAGTLGGSGQIIESVTRDAKGRVTGITTIATPTGGTATAGTSTTTVQSLRDKWTIVTVTDPTLANVQSAVNATNGTGTHIIVSGGARAITSQLTVNGKPNLWLEFRGAIWTRSDDTKMVEVYGDATNSRYSYLVLHNTFSSTANGLQNVFTTNESTIGNNLEIDHNTISVPNANANCMGMVQYSAQNVAGSKTSTNVQVYENRIGPCGRMGGEFLAQRAGAVTDAAYIKNLYIRRNFFTDCGRVSTDGHGMFASVDGAIDSLYIDENKGFDANNKTWEVVNTRNSWIRKNYVLNTKFPAVTGVSVTAGNWPTAVNVTVEDNETITTGSPYNYNDIAGLKMFRNIGTNPVNTSPVTNNGVTLTRVSNAQVNSNAIRVAGNRALYLENTTTSTITSNTLSSEYNYTNTAPVYVYGAGSTGNLIQFNKLAKYPGSYLAAGSYISDVSSSTTNTTTLNEVITAGYPHLTTVNSTTVVVLKLDGAGNNAGDIYDSSPNPKPIQKIGNPVNSTTQFKYGGSSLYFDGASALYIAKTTDFDLGTADFTLEAWIYPTATPGSGNYPGLVSRLSGTQNVAWTWGLTPTLSGADFNIVNSSGAYTNPGPSSTTATPINTWQHVALVSIGGVRKMYQNGTLTSTSSSAPSMELNGSAQGLMIGVQNQFPFYQGYMHLRFTKGIGLYSANFTPPTSF